VRADARRNRDRLLAAATELLLELGGEPPLDAIARRAEVGIATLYRHFPDREHLLHAVAERALAGSIEAAETALLSDGDGLDALRGYMHAAVELGAGVLNVVRPLLSDPDWGEQRARMEELLATLLERGREQDLLRPEVGGPDIVLPIIRFSRPVDLGSSRRHERELAHRHLDIYIDGLANRQPNRTSRDP
jgi:AcrR family transcriptional regulator